MTCLHINVTRCELTRTDQFCKTVTPALYDISVFYKCMCCLLRLNKKSFRLNTDVKCFHPLSCDVIWNASLIYFVRLLFQGVSDESIICSAVRDSDSGPSDPADAVWMGFVLDSSEPL